MSGIVERKNLIRTADYLSSWQTTLLLGGCFTYCFGRLWGKVAKDSALGKMETAFGSFWAFDDFARATGSVVIIAKDWSAAQDTDRTPDQIREGGVDAYGKAIHPKEDMCHSEHRAIWAARRITGTALKAFSASILVYGGLHSVGVFKNSLGNTTKALGVTAGIAGLSQEIYDLYVQSNDYDAHNLYNQLVNTKSRDKFIAEKKKTVPGYDEAQFKSDFDDAIKQNIFYSQLMKVLIIGVKVMSLTSVLNKIEGSPLFGRVDGLVNHSHHIYGNLFLGMAVLWGWQYFKVYADLNEWKKEVPKDKWDPGYMAKYAFQDFTDKRDLVRTVMASTSTLIDYGYETIDFITECELGPLGKLAKNFDSFFSISQVPKQLKGFCKSSVYILSKTAREAESADRVARGKDALTIWRALGDSAIAFFKLLGDSFSAAKFIGGFGGVVWLSDRLKKINHLKCGFKSAAAAMTIAQESPLMSDWEKKGKYEPIISVLVIWTAANSLFLNGASGLSSAYGHLIPAPGKQNFEPWAYNFAAINATLAGAAIGYAR